VDVLKLFASIALRTVRLQQLLHYGVTTHCCETLAQALAMWWASQVTTGATPNDFSLDLVIFRFI